MKKGIFWAAFFLLFIVKANAQAILSVKEQAKAIDELLEERLNHLLPNLMDEAQIDMWILISREYNEDPVLKTMLPADWMHARRTTMLLFYKDPKSSRFDKLAVARYNIGESITSAWDKDQEPDQWKRLVSLILERNPRKIALNFSRDHNIADGLSKNDYEVFMNYLPKKLHPKVVSAENLAVSWIETRTPKEMVLYSHLVEITHEIIKEAFSSKVITPGITTTSDVEWFFRQRVSDLGLQTWFHPTVDIQRTSENLVSHLYSFSGRPQEAPIMPGDLLHCDFGIQYLRLNTDCQELAYVLRPTEEKAPDFLINALAQGNAVQDHLTNNFIEGRVGNKILLEALESAKAVGLKPAIYTHPLGLYGHSAGTTIGMWDAQEGIDKADGSGYPLRKNTVYAIELNATVAIPEWKRSIRIMLEEAGFFGENGFRYVNGRQKELLLIPSKASYLGE